MFVSAAVKPSGVKGPVFHKSFLLADALDHVSEQFSLNEEQVGMKRILNRDDYCARLRQENGWQTVSYARKSRTNETVDKGIKCLQRMVNALHIEDLCTQVYASPHENSDALLLHRDKKLSPMAIRAKEALRFTSGDFQGK